MKNASLKLIETTESLCPVCLRKLPAEVRRNGEEIMLCRVCPDHGAFQETIWRGKPDFETWRRPKTPVTGLKTQTSAERGCPNDCGRCPDHGQHACTVLLELTTLCNLRCPVCFANSGSLEDTPVPADTFIERMHWIREEAGEVVLQLSGGEPTLYPELAPLVKEGLKLFPAVQLNTNGIRLAEDFQMVQELAEAGLSWVFLQFDGVSDQTFEKIRGRALFDIKMKAIEACAKAGLSVVLVPTVAAGINDHEMGELFRLALSLGPTVRGVHIQPMTTSGRNPFPGSAGRLTLPEILTKLHEQTGGLVRPEAAFPPSCEHERCSFHLRYRRKDDGTIVPMGGESECCCKTTDVPLSAEETAEGRRRSVEVTLNSWQAPAPKPLLGIPMSGQTNAFDEFIAKARQEVFSLTCMAFQDVWTADLARLRGCCVHVFSPPDKLMPFCAFNLTSADGRPLHRRG
ncbi:radical SAM protein [Deltaproteobacteria bacterium Smac51]|nr:radical SAM protein [Deltaproteobacteria bacterium Smac51]